MVIPVQKFTPDLPVLQSLQLVRLDSEQDEILVVEGDCPSAQRNQAAREAKGEYLVFLDSDSQVRYDYFKKIEVYHKKDHRFILGGPALLREEASTFEAFCQAVFCCPVLLGKSAARYQSTGIPRETDQAELILCNLVVSRSVWNLLGGFHEGLYPNEENEWLDRASEQGVTLIYDPQVFVRRAQRESYGELFKTFFRYGCGRGEQTVISRKISKPHFALAWVVPAMVFSILIFGWGNTYSVFSGLIFIHMVMAMGSLLGSEFSKSTAFLVGVFAPFLWMSYGLGQWKGWVTGFLKRGKNSIQSEKQFSVIRVSIP